MHYSIPIKREDPTEFCFHRYFLLTTPKACYNFLKEILFGHTIWFFPDSLKNSGVKIWKRLPRKGFSLTFREPKSGREQEFIFIPQRLADRLKDYIRDKGIQPQHRIFPIRYEAAREVVAKAGRVVAFI